ncbi:nuclear transport factor 2 family protein [Christiangramia sp. SM2212]|uniref:Nuclear transport factor 2 family protein n=1 Tax=Christiangramia sediminicola TaxID=3073267 RepID=A0ABU1EQG8_9FLAO|nr:nuclear transport factor 2 family protein [Christiangramia sp. SM2212]MDR5590637.1 nuclear transport factor 2 family protein [Christiangramia sp. SM2212]
MKKLLMVAVFLTNLAVFSQTDKDEATPKKLVQDFFEAFHDQDTVKLKSFAVDSMQLQSISKDAEGNTQVSTTEYSKFLKNIASIPAETNFEEKLHEFRIEENGLLATVTTPYSFYFNGNFSHCGVNSFQLVNFSGEWKIVYLVDTRTKEDCY